MTASLALGGITSNHSIDSVLISSLILIEGFSFLYKLERQVLSGSSTW